MIVEPICDMPWDIYLDWLQDQGNEDLRFIDYTSLIFGDHNWQNYIFYFADYSGEGYSGEFTDGETLVRDWDNDGIIVFSGYGGDIHLRDSGCPDGSDDATGCSFMGESNQDVGFGFCGRIEISDYDRALL